MSAVATPRSSRSGRGRTLYDYPGRFVSIDDAVAECQQQELPLRICRNIVLDETLVVAPRPDNNPKSWRARGVLEVVTDMLPEWDANSSRSASTGGRLRGSLAVPEAHGRSDSHRVVESLKGEVFRVCNGGHLILRGIHMKGGGTDAADVLACEAGMLEMSRCRVTGGCAGIVIRATPAVQGAPGRVVLDAVHVDRCGTGIIVADRGLVTMHLASVEKCATGVVLRGNAEAEMLTCVIRNCEKHGVHAKNSAVICRDVSISECSGEAAVRIAGDWHNLVEKRRLGLTMFGGEIGRNGGDGIVAIEAEVVLEGVSIDRQMGDGCRFEGAVAVPRNHTRLRTSQIICDEDVEAALDEMSEDEGERHVPDARARMTECTVTRNRAGVVAVLAPTDLIRCEIHHNTWVDVAEYRPRRLEPRLPSSDPIVVFEEVLVPAASSGSGAVDNTITWRGRRLQQLQVGPPRGTEANPPSLGGFPNLLFRDRSEIAVGSQTDLDCWVWPWPDERENRGVQT
mmetsp:Transcript_27322/g.65873  ORF Transcript_27322/g.65873 Transcript_27322/m.65873 type:complete len:511 (+) Transcript_27322:52-1584(+)